MTHLKITGMTCDGCAAHVKAALVKVPGVQSADVSYATGSARLALNGGTAPQDLIAAVTGLGSGGSSRRTTFVTTTVKARRRQIVVRRDATVAPN